MLTVNLLSVGITGLEPNVDVKSCDFWFCRFEFVAHQCSEEVHTQSPSPSSSLSSSHSCVYRPPTSSGGCIHSRLFLFISFPFRPSSTLSLQALSSVCPSSLLYPTPCTPFQPPPRISRHRKFQMRTIDPTHHATQKSYYMSANGSQSRSFVYLFGWRHPLSTPSF